MTTFALPDHEEPRPMADHTTGELWQWVDRLTLDRRQRLVRKPVGGKPRIEYVDVPSLWTQLIEAEASNNAGGGHGKATTGSRSPIHLPIVDLLTEITGYVVDALRAHGATPRFQLEHSPVRHRPITPPVLANEFGRPLIDPDTAGRLVERAARAAAQHHPHHDTARRHHDTRTDLRQLATVIVGVANQDLTDWWANRYRWWTARAETALAADDESVDLRGIRGHACPACSTQWVLRNSDGEDVRDPALVIAFHDGQVQHATCRACGTGWWRGDELEQLAAAVRTATTPRPAAAGDSGQPQPATDDPNTGGRLRGRDDTWWL